jgi:hypothetical protein
MHHPTPTETFDTGATRSKLDGMRYDLISPFGLQRLAARYALGAKNFGDNNWRKGMPFSALMNHLMHHLAMYLAGERDDDHLAAAAWGLFAMMEQEETNPKMNDLYDFGEVGLEEEEPAMTPDELRYAVTWLLRHDGVGLDTSPDSEGMMIS